MTLEAISATLFIGMTGFAIYLIWDLRGDTEAFKKASKKQKPKPYTQVTK